MCDIADIGEGHRGSGLYTRTARPKRIFDIVIADLDLVDPVRDWPCGSGDFLRSGRRPQRTQLPFQREYPHRIAVCAQLRLIAASRDCDILVSVYLINRGRGIGSEAGLEPPQLFACLGIDREEVAVGLAAEDKAAGRRRRPAPLTDTIGSLVLPDDIVGVAADCGEG